MNKKKVVLLSAAIIFIIGIACFLNVFIITHELNIEQIDEIKCDKIIPYTNDQKYFVLKDGFYDGFAFFEWYLPDYDKAKLDDEKYTYFVALNRKINSIKYNGSRCLMRTYLAFPEEYAAILDCEETNDETIRIYRMKKINIDYDFHSGKDIPEPTGLVGKSYIKDYLQVIGALSLIYWGGVFIILKVSFEKKKSVDQ